MRSGPFTPVLAGALAVSAALAAAPALAAGGHSGGHGHGGGAAHGRAGEAAEVDRTVEVVMHDTRYAPETIEVAAGETVRFRVRNAGALVHEFNIGTAAMHAAHQDEMMTMMEQGVLHADHVDEDAARAMQASMGHGMHDDPNSALLEPGESAEVIWTFPASGEMTLEFACNVPGHYESGMVGELHVGHGH